MKKLTFLAVMMMCFCTAFAQEPGADVEMADLMRSSGKIYVVVGTIAIVFIGLAIYLFTIDRRIKKLEREN